jgi:hypothetical protein
MTGNTTKVVSARLLLGSYLQIAAAGEKKMTVADFVLLKLFAHPILVLSRCNKPINRFSNLTPK